MMPQNKINGTSIAWGRGVWTDLGDGQMGYAFLDSDGFKITVTPQWLDERGVSEDDLLDCVEQIEERFGDPDEYRLKMGLLPNQGYSNTGIVVKSRTNPEVICVFTPTSIDPAMNSQEGWVAEASGYFEWYLDPQSYVSKNLGAWMVAFDSMSGNRGSEILASPVMPQYGEACEKSLGLMVEHEREHFLNQVWLFHKRKEHGMKQRYLEAAMPIWTKILNEYNEKQKTKSSVNVEDIQDVNMSVAKIIGLK